MSLRVSRAPDVRVVAAVLSRPDERVFVARRAYGAYANTWEFPGGKREPGESAEETIRRELLEEEVVDPTAESRICVGNQLASTTLQIEGAHVEIQHVHVQVPLRDVREAPPEGEGRAHLAYAWMSWDELLDLPVRACSPGMAALLGTRRTGVSS